jgi:hypothetical protein
VLERSAEDVQCQFFQCFTVSIMDEVGRVVLVVVMVERGNITDTFGLFHS